MTPTVMLSPQMGNLLDHHQILCLVISISSLMVLYVFLLICNQACILNKTWFMISLIILLKDLLPLQHNFTDGMALGSAFLLHGSVGGWSRTLFLLAHEIPQEVWALFFCSFNTRASTSSYVKEAVLILYRDMVINYVMENKRKPSSCRKCYLCLVRECVPLRVNSAMLFVTEFLSSLNFAIGVWVATFLVGVWWSLDWQ